MFSSWWETVKVPPGMKDLLRRVNWYFTYITQTPIETANVLGVINCLRNNKK